MLASGWNDFCVRREEGSVMYTQAEEEQCARTGMALQFHGKPAFPIPASEVPPMVVKGPKVYLNHIDQISMCSNCGRCEDVNRGGCRSGSKSGKKCWCPIGTLWITDEKPVNSAYGCKGCRNYYGVTPGSCNGGDGVNCFEPKNGMLLVRDEVEE